MSSQCRSMVHAGCVVLQLGSTHVQNLPVEFHTHGAPFGKMAFPHAAGVAASKTHKSTGLQSSLAQVHSLTLPLVSHEQEGVGA